MKTITTTRKSPPRWPWGLSAAKLSAKEAYEPSAHWAQSCSRAKSNASPLESGYRPDDQSVQQVQQRREKLIEHVPASRKRRYQPHKIAPLCACAHKNRCNALRSTGIHSTNKKESLHHRKFIERSALSCTNRYRQPSAKPRNAPQTTISFGRYKVKSKNCVERNTR